MKEKQKPHWNRFARTTLIASLIFLGAQAGTFAEGPEPESDAVELDSFTVDSDGHMEVNGVEFKEKEKAPATFVYAEVEKSLPTIEGSTVLFLRPLEFRQEAEDGRFVTTEVKGEEKAFLFDLEWVMFDSDGNKTIDPQMAVNVLMPSPVEGNALTFNVVWNECDGAVTGNYIGYKCSKKRGMADEYAKYLKANILPCVNVGLAKVGGGTASRVHILHDGTVADQNHSSSSLHAIGRAVDIMSMKVTSNRGTVEYSFKDTSSKPNGSNRKFYEGLRSCWGRLQAKRRCQARSGGPIGTIGWEDKRHRGHHLHMSMPFCPNSRGYFITDSSSK